MTCDDKINRIGSWKGVVFQLIFNLSVAIPKYSLYIFCAVLRYEMEHSFEYEYSRYCVLEYAIENLKIKVFPFNGLQQPPAVAHPATTSTETNHQIMKLF